MTADVVDVRVAVEDIDQAVADFVSNVPVKLSYPVAKALQAPTTARSSSSRHRAVPS